MPVDRRAIGILVGTLDAMPTAKRNVRDFPRDRTIARLGVGMYSVDPIEVLCNKLTPDGNSWHVDVTLRGWVDIEPDFAGRIGAAIPMDDRAWLTFDGALVEVHYLSKRQTKLSIRTDTMPVLYDA